MAIKQRLALPPYIEQVPPRRFKLDRHSEYYSDDRFHMKQHQMLNFKQLYSTYSQILIFDMDKVKGSILSKLRRDLQIYYQSELFIGKNTVVKRMIEELEELSEISREKNALKELRNHMIGSICLVFTDCNALEMKQFVESRVTHELPQVGTKMGEDFYLEPNLTNLDPAMTSFFSALGIRMKISKGLIQISDRILLLRKGQMIGYSEYTLLKKLKLEPCKIGCRALHIFDRMDFVMYHPQVLDHNLTDSIYEAMDTIGSISMECNLFNQLSVIINLKKGIHNLLALQNQVKNP